jgi:hypothetical protein
MTSLVGRQEGKPVLALSVNPVPGENTSLSGLFDYCSCPGRRNRASENQNKKPASCAYLVVNL